MQTCLNILMTYFSAFVSEEKQHYVGLRRGQLQPFKVHVAAAVKLVGNLLEQGQRYIFTFMFHKLPLSDVYPWGVSDVGLIIGKSMT
jgi:hypothetical protein